MLDQGAADYGLITQFLSDRTARCKAMKAEVLTDEVKEALAEKQTPGKADGSPSTSAAQDSRQKNKSTDGGEI